VNIGMVNRMEMIIAQRTGSAKLAEAEGQRGLFHIDTSQLGVIKGTQARHDALRLSSARITTTEGGPARST
jgi:hypothetical protein